MSLDFQELVKFYRKAKRDKKTGKFTYFIENIENLNLIEELISEDNYLISKLNVIDGSLEVGQLVSVDTSQPDAKFGRLYDTIEKFLVADMKLITNETYRETPYYIIFEEVASFDEKMPKVLLSYKIIKEFILQLMSMDAYTDKVRKNLIFFSRKTLELSIDVDGKIRDFISELEKIDKDLCTRITNFNQWLSDRSETNSHSDEKKSILAFVLSDILPEKPDIIHVVRRIETIIQAVQAQYGLYLENFSYAKFVKKLEENSEKFITRINDTINKVLPQLLGVPFLAAIVTVLKAGENALVYAALFTYCLISILVLKYQKAVLDDIWDEIKKYIEAGKIPGELKSQWIVYKNKFHKFIKQQKLLYWVLLTSASLCLFYSLYQLSYCEPFRSTILMLQKWITTSVNSVNDNTNLNMISLNTVMANYYN